ncbi:hypothetical protein [Salinicoccus kekensis]|uniref:Uncharacterized protein n=1 Tax=Salinicoccus kekensis TaxID=714307 RepID=A0A285UJC8_9STAP|nr:hypothetical protein [Salinicoccus kekensis]SOC42005.1 hypothetical protein SAMN05878391_1487 [Salinicoccus kekensis]
MNNNRVKNGTMDLSYISLIGALWYIPIFTVIYIGIFLIFGSGELDNLSYMSVGLNSNRIFMLVMGIIIGGGFIKWAIGLGVTRKQFHKANIYSGAMMSVALTITMIVLGLIIGLLPFVGTENIQHNLDMHPVMNLITVALQVYLAYLAGSLIGIGFYKNGWFGALAIVITVVCNFLSEALDPFLVNALGLAEGAGILITVIAVIIVLIIVNRYFIKDIAIKI